MVHTKILLPMILGFGLFSTFSSNATTFPFGIYKADKNKECKTNKDQIDDILFKDLCLPAKEFNNNKALDYMTKYLEANDPEQGDYNDVIYYRLKFNNYNSAKKQIVINKSIINISDQANSFNPKSGNTIILVNDGENWSVCYNTKVYSATISNESLVNILSGEPSVAKFTEVLNLPECSTKE